MNAPKNILPDMPRTNVAWAEASDYLETLYEQWKQAPSTLSESWQNFFQGFDLGKCERACVAAQNAAAQAQVIGLIEAYRREGHRLAKLDPLGHNQARHAPLELETWGFRREQLIKIYDAGDFASLGRATLQDILTRAQTAYCQSIGVEYAHVQNAAERSWLQNQIESAPALAPLAQETQLEILRCLIDAELFETFLHSRYVGQKRFSLEGAESLIPAVHALVELAPQLDVEEIVIGMPHRGRLNMLANILDKSYDSIFSEFEDVDSVHPIGGDGDVKYHKGFSSDHRNALGQTVHLVLSENPSHLEAVDPVVEGRVRAKQRQRHDTAKRKKVLPLLIHGDAAFAGQGIVAENFNLARLEGYTTGGTVHIIVNNQIGFTTLPSEGRSTTYATEIAKMIEAPIFHVNGDDPEAVVRVTELALRYRQEFSQDAVVDMMCYRRHGHNEGDEPQFTQPAMYAQIKTHPSVRKIYTDKLLTLGTLSTAQEMEIAAQFKQRLQQAFDQVKESKVAPPMPLTPQLASEDSSWTNRWSDLFAAYADEAAVTSVPLSALQEIAKALNTVPAGFNLHPKIARQLPERLSSVTEDGQVEWGYAELLAFGSLLSEKIPVRLSGQDSARGTFSQRHAVWHDAQTEEKYIALNHLGGEQAKFCVYNSSLSEAAVLGFDFGYSLEEPQMLVLWEAQFGDFANGAQVIIDQFLISSEDKWGRTSGLVLLLPHGQEGQGPEHAHAYLERYLQLCAQNNIQVCNLSTAAQYFHVLRRQMKRNFRRPLILMTPKSMLRDPRAFSPVSELCQGQFQEIIDDPRPPVQARVLLFCSGKIFWELEERRTKAVRDDVAIVRIEQLYPLSERLMSPIAERYQHVNSVRWVQEETMNRGAWMFMQPRLSSYFPGRMIKYVGRPATASPAPGSARQHRLEQERIFQMALRGDQ